MKSYTNLVVILILVAFSGTVFAGENEYKATENEELFGTWVNMDYKDGNHSQMMLFKLGETEAYSDLAQKSGHRVKPQERMFHTPAELRNQSTNDVFCGYKRFQCNKICFESLLIC